jgi:hypothetical protein
VGAVLTIGCPIAISCPTLLMYAAWVDTVTIGYELTAVVAAEPLLWAKADLPGSRVIAVGLGFAVLPLPDPVCQDMDQRYGGEFEAGFTYLRAGFAAQLARWSLDGALAYVEADFFGGRGGQCAVVWEKGTRVLTIRSPVTPGQRSPISQALRRLGVETEDGGWDEFDAVGLGRHRRTECWLQA